MDILRTDSLINVPSNKATQSELQKFFDDISECSSAALPEHLAKIVASFRYQAALTLVSRNGRDNSDLTWSGRKLAGIAQDYSYFGRDQLDSSVRISMRQIVPRPDKSKCVGISEASIVLAHWYIRSLCEYISDSRQSQISLLMSASADDLGRGEIMRWLQDAHDVESEVNIKRTVAEIVQGVMRSLVQALDECNRLGYGGSIVKPLELAKEFCEEESSWQKIVAALLISPTLETHAVPVPRYGAAWVLCYLLKAIAKHVWKKNFCVSLHVPDAADVVRLWASSDQLAPYTEKIELHRFPVAKHHLVGGLMSTVGVPVADDQSSVETNSNHFDEGGPTAHLCIPLVPDIDRVTRYALPGNAQGQLVISLLEERGDFSFANSLNNILFYVYTNYTQQYLAPGTYSVPWWTWLLSIREYPDLQCDLMQRMRHLNGMDIPSQLIRDVWIIVVSQSEAHAGENVRTIIHSLAQERARKRAYQVGGPSTPRIYKLPQEAAYVVFRQDMIEVDWTKLRDLGRETIGPFPIRYAVSRAIRPNSRTAGSVMEYSVTRSHPYLIDSMKAGLSPDTITEQILQQIEFTAAKISELNELRQFYHDHNYYRALALVMDVLDTRLAGKDCLLNDASRLSLNHKEFAHASEFARQRVKYMPGELTGHANLLLALLANGDLNAVQLHIFGEAQMHGCDQCKAHPPLGTKTSHPNPMLTCCLTLFELTRILALERSNMDKLCQKISFLEEKLDDAIRVLAPDTAPGEGFIASLIVEAITSGTKTSINYLKKKKWSLMRTAGANISWREHDALQRLLCAASGVAITLWS